MTDATRARIVRGWLLCAALIAAWLSFPGWAWWAVVAPVVPMFLAGCCCGSSLCSLCSPGTQTTQIQVDISGVINGSVCADCASINGTWVVDVTTEAANCRYKYIEFATICAANGFIQILNIILEWKLASVEVLLAQAGGETYTFQDGTLSDPVDCGAQVLSVPFVSSSDGTLRCDFSATTLDVTPL